MQTAKLVLVSKRGVNGAPPSAPLAFALRGEVDARGPLKRIKTSAQLYEFQEVEVKLTNPFQVLLLELGQSFQSVMHACVMVKLLMKNIVKQDQKRRKEFSLFPSKTFP